MIHNPQHYARDFYFFKRAQYPQLSLVHKKPAQAFLDLQRQCFLYKFAEIGKVMLTWGILKVAWHSHPQNSTRDSLDPHFSAMNSSTMTFLNPSSMNFLTMNSRVEISSPQ